MAEEQAKAPAPEAAPPPAPKKGGMGTALTFIIPAILAGGGAFGGAKVAGGGNKTTQVEVVVTPPRPPGATLPLEPFLVSVPDAEHRLHAMKLTMAIELRHLAKEEEFKPFMPRIRDTTLVYLRSLSYETAGDSGRLEQMRAELLNRFQAVGATQAERVLITDFVMQ